MLTYKPLSTAVYLKIIFRKKIISLSHCIALHFSNCTYSAVSPIKSKSSKSVFQFSNNNFKISIWISALHLSSTTRKQTNIFNFKWTFCVQKWSKHSNIPSAIWRFLSAKCNAVEIGCPFMVFIVAFNGTPRSIRDCTSPKSAIKNLNIFQNSLFFRVYRLTTNWLCYIPHLMAFTSFLTWRDFALGPRFCLNKIQISEMIWSKGNCNLTWHLLFV